MDQLHLVNHAVERVVMQMHLTKPKIAFELYSENIDMR